MSSFRTESINRVIVELTDSDIRVALRMYFEGRHGKYCGLVTHLIIDEDYEDSTKYRATLTLDEVDK